MKERVLSIGLKDAIEAFEINKWKFYEIDEDGKLVRIEVPRGYTETYVVELPYGENPALLKDYMDALQVAGFYHQTIRQRCNY